MKTEHVIFPCGEISLEGILHLPEASSPLPAAVVCHPHPQYGGDMENNVVMAVCDALVSRSIAALRCNFRGVGGSGGSYGGGIKERDDARSALDYLESRTEIDCARLGLAGYSFGGAVAFAVAQPDTRIRKLVLISPALNEAGWEQLKACSRPKLVLLGDADTTISYTQFKRYFSGDTSFQVIAGADHFWWGYEGEIRRRVREFFLLERSRQTDN